MNWKRLVPGVGAGVAVVLSVLLLLPTLNLMDTPFSAYESDDDDISIMVNGMRAQGYEVASLSLGPMGLTGVDPARSNALYLAVGVDRGYTEPELDSLWSFLEQGGQAIVMDDSGASDRLLDRLGVSKGSLLLSTTGDQASAVPVQIGDTLVTLWEPVELLPRESADVRVLARADNTTAKDVDGNGEIQADEPTCSPGCAVALEAPVGQGSLVFVSDATFATSKYATGSGALPLLQALSTGDGAGARSLVIVDESRHVVGFAEIGLTLFRTLLVPLGLPVIPWALSGLLVALTIVSIIRGREDTWPDHDPGLDRPYLSLDPEELPDRARPGHGGDGA